MDLHMKCQLSLREEANAITCHVFRNGFLEDLHAGRRSELLDNDELSRITDEEMKKLMIESSREMAKLLDLREIDPDEYWKKIQFVHTRYSKHWND